MAVVEKRAGVAMSWGAMGASVLLAGWLLVAGNAQPRKYVASMAINHHAAYGSAVGCNGCHDVELLKAGVEMPAMTCATANCHGELLNPPSQKSLSDLEAKRGFEPHFDRWLEYHLALHGAAADQDCTACHSEHKNYEPDYPEGFVPFEEWLQQQDTAMVWHSVRAQIFQ